MDTFRTFIAIELPRELRARVTEHIDRLRREAPDVRASYGREGNLHLTMKFLGNIPIARITDVTDAVERATSAIGPFEIVVSGCGSFPPHGRPSVLWIGALSEPRPVGVAGGPNPGTKASSLHYLHRRIEDSLAAAGFPPESRAFHPHLTIARLRSPQGARSLADLHNRLGFNGYSFTVSDVVVFRSELLKEGSKHTPISRHRLR